MDQPAKATGSARTEGPLATLFDAMRPDLLRFLAARCGEGGLAQDLLQDMWLRLVDRDPGPLDNGRAYLFRMANNMVLDHRRGAQRAMARDRAWIEQDGQPSGLVDAPDPLPTAEELIIEQQEIARLKLAVAQLPAGAQTAIRLYRFDGLSQPEVAERMGISRSGVEKHLALAMRQLREALLPTQNYALPPAPSVTGPQGNRTISGQSS
jgi:RNA polymerase sigma-70 factor (ECF subfamily)